MLHAWQHPHSGELRLYIRIRGVSSEAWISPAPAQTGTNLFARRGPDWVLFVRSGDHLTLQMCPARLQVQSLLRAWLLQKYRRPLFIMSFADLQKLAKK